MGAYMIIKNVVLTGFGKFRQVSIPLKPGLNLIYGKNEAGKTTIKTFFLGMMYGIEKQRGRASKNDTYSLYQPLDGGAYAGIMDILVDDIPYRIQRNFDRNNKEVRLFYEESGKEISVSQNGLAGMLWNVSKEAYVNTRCIGQQEIKTGQALTQAVVNYMANLTNTGSNQFDVKEIYEYLAKEKKNLQEKDLDIKIEQLQLLLENHQNVDQEIKELWQEEKKTTDSLNKLKQLKNIEKENQEAYKDQGDYKEQEAYKDQGQYQNQEAYKDQEQYQNQQDQRKITTYPARSNQSTDKHIRSKKQQAPKSNHIIFAILFMLLELGVLIALNISSIYIALILILTGIIFFYKVRIQRKKKRQNNPTCYHEETVEEDQKKIETNLQDQKSNFNELISPIFEYEKKLDIIKVKLDYLLASQHIKEELMEDYQNLKKQKNEIEYNKKAIDIAIAAIKELSVDIHGDFGNLLNKEVSEIVSKITKGKYTKVRIDENLGIMVEYNHAFLNIEYLSVGTVEQIYFALRLAAAKLLYPKEQMPLLIDDMFGNYDEERLSETLDYILQQQNGQVILFTCKKEIRSMLENKKARFSCITL